MDRLNAPGSVPFANRDIAPVTGTRQYATDGVPGVTPRTQWPAYAWNMIQDEIIKVITEAGLTPNDVDWTQLWQALQALYGKGRLLNVQKFFTAGTFTYTPTPGTNSVLVEGQGAGGGSGGVGPNSGSDLS